MVEAQATWDATMAFHAAELIKDNPDPKAVVVVLVGSGHVAYNLGIARQAKAYTDKRVATVMPIAMSPDKSEEIRASVADIVWGVPTETYPLHPTLGVSFRSSGDQPTTVLMVTPGSPAEAMGLKAGDMLMTLDGQPIRKDVEGPGPARSQAVGRCDYGHHQARRGVTDADGPPAAEVGTARRAVRSRTPRPSA